MVLDRYFECYKRGKLKNKIAFLVSPSLPSLEKFKSSFQTGSSFKNIHIVTDIAHLQSLGDSADVILTLPDVIGMFSSQLW